MHKPTNARLHVLVVCCYQDSAERMSHTALPLLPTCFDVANLKIKTHISKHKRMFVYMFMRLFVCLCMRINACMFVYVFICLFICAYIYSFVCLCVHLCICVFA